MSARVKKDLEIILLEHVKHLGQLGELVRVARGYFRNYLRPRNKAVIANKRNIELLKTQQALLEQQLAEKIAEAEKMAANITALATITLVGRASEEGKLYGSVGVKEIIAKLAENNIILTRDQHKILLPDSHGLRQLGSHTVAIQVYENITADLTVNIEAI